MAAFFKRNECYNQNGLTMLEKILKDRPITSFTSFK